MITKQKSNTPVKRLSLDQFKENQLKEMDGVRGGDGIFYDLGYAVGEFIGGLIGGDDGSQDTCHD